MINIALVKTFETFNFVVTMALTGGEEDDSAEG
jgi:hypothetical protein